MIQLALTNDQLSALRLWLVDPAVGAAVIWAGKRSASSLGRHITESLNRIITENVNRVRDDVKKKLSDDLSSIKSDLQIYIDVKFQEHENSAFGRLGTVQEDVKTLQLGQDKLQVQIDMLVKLLNDTNFRSVKPQVKI